MVGAATREELLADTFLLLADTLVEDFDLIEALTVLVDRCVALLGATASGIMVADAHGALQVIAESSKGAHVLQLPAPARGGALHRRVRQPAPVNHADLATSPWPGFGPAAIVAGLERCTCSRCACALRWSAR